MKRKIPLPKRLLRRPLQKGRFDVNLSLRREQQLLGIDPLILLAEKLGLQETETKNIYKDSRGYSFLRTEYGFINNK